MELQLLFKGTPAQFGVAVNSFGERLFRRSGQPQLINVYPDPPPSTANPVTTEIFLNWKGPLQVTAQSIPGGRSLLFLSIQDADWHQFAEYWEMLYRELERQGWFEAFGSGELKARDVQQRILEFLLQWEETAPGLRKNILIGGVGDRIIAGKLSLDTQVVRDNLVEIERRGCIWVKRYLAGRYRLVVSLTARGRIIAREPDYLQQPSAVQVTNNISTDGGAVLVGNQIAQSSINIDSTVGTVISADHVDATINNENYRVTQQTSGQDTYPKSTPEGVAELYRATDEIRAREKRRRKAQ